MKLVVDIPKSELDFFRQFIKRMKGAKAEEINGKSKHVLLSKKQWAKTQDELDELEDIKLYDKAMKDSDQSTMTFKEFEAALKKNGKK